jgi:branched-chain amino acid transport system permease protein
MSATHSIAAKRIASKERELRILGFSGARAVALLVLIAFVATAPFVVYPVFLMQVYVFMMFACAYNLLLGYAGLMSFGHAAYFGMGAYVTALTAARLGLPPEAAVLAGTVVGALLGAIFGWLAIRRKGLYFAMITLAFAQMLYFTYLQAPITGGENGVQNVPRGSLFGWLSLQSDTTLYWVVAVLFIFVFVFVNRIVHSPFGQVLKAIKENEARATSLGYQVDVYKLCAFVISAGLSGFAGGVKTVVFGIATLTDVSLSTSTDVVLMGLVGGVGTIFGPVLGALTTLSIEHFLTPYGAWVAIVQGVIFMVFVLLFRAGIVGELQRRLKVKL